jgi:hypothetical protein
MDQGGEGFDVVIDFAHIGHVGKSGTVNQMDGVAIGGRSGRRVGANGRAAPGAVIEHNGLPQYFFCFTAHNAGPLIGAAARRVRHDQLDGFFRKSSRPSGLS